MKGSPEDIALAAIGAVEGGWKYYVKPALTANRAWGVLLASAGLYEVIAPEGELLSEGFQRGLNQQRLLTIGAWAVTSAHLLRLLPEQIDPFTIGVKQLKKYNNR